MNAMMVVAAVLFLLPVAVVLVLYAVQYRRTQRLRKANAQYAIVFKGLGNRLMKDAHRRRERHQKRT